MKIIEEIKENDFNLSVNTYVRYEEPKEEVNPIELDKKARKDFIQKIKQQIILQKEICKIDNTLEPVERFIDEIEQEIKKVKEQIKC